jgi:hypothetical protein
MATENDFARIRAEMLMQQSESPSYDDGASLLMQDPNMMRVGLFGRKPPKPMEPPVNLARRGIIGMGQAAQENLPAVRPADIPLPSSSPLPMPVSTPGAMQPARPPVQQPTPPHTLTPLEALAQNAINTPMSRREVLKRAGQTAVNQMLPTPGISDALSPLQQVVKVDPLKAIKAAVLGALAPGAHEMAAAYEDPFAMYGAVSPILEKYMTAKEKKALEKGMELYSEYGQSEGLDGLEEAPVKDAEKIYRAFDIYDSAIYKAGDEIPFETHMQYFSQYQNKLNLADLEDSSFEGKITPEVLEELKKQDWAQDIFYDFDPPNNTRR